jgi:uncharacterized protein (DUF885 family)
MAAEDAGTTTWVRGLADTFHERWLTAHPFTATYYGIPGHDDQVPDDSEAGEAGWRGELESMLTQARRLEQPQLPEADAITLACLIENIHQELREFDAGLIEHTVTAMPFSGPAVLLATAARTVMVDAQAAADYLERLRRSGEWIDQQTERLRIGAGKGPTAGGAARGAGDRVGRDAPSIAGARPARCRPPAGGLGRRGVVARGA